MDIKVIYALCIIGGLFLPGEILGIGLLIYPHKFINLALKGYDKFSFLGFTRPDLWLNPHGKATVIFYRILGLALILAFAIPILIILFGCVFKSCA
jgi:hypothetical protein